MQKLFRDNAIKNLNSLPDLNTSLQIIHPTTWLAILCAICLLMSFLLWTIWGTIALTIPFIGIIITDTELQQAETELKENLQEHAEKVATLQDLFAKNKYFYSKHSITLNDLEKARENYLAAKDELATLSRQNITKPLIGMFPDNPEQSLDALVFVAHMQGKKIAPGMDTYILPDTVSAYEYGYVLGKVLSVSAYPVSKETVFSYLGNMSLVEEFFGNSVPFMVKVRLMKDQTTQSGLAWTSRQGANFKVGAGTTVTGKIVNKTYSPWRLITNLAHPA